MAYCLWQGPTHIARSNSEVVRRCLKLFGVPRSSSVALLPLQGSIRIYSELLAATRSSSEFLGATLSLLDAPPRDRDLLIFTRSCSELFGVAGSNSVVASCSPYRDLFIITRSCSELLGVHRSFSEQLCRW